MSSHPRQRLRRKAFSIPSSISSSQILFWTLHLELAQAFAGPLQIPNHGYSRPDLIPCYQATTPRIPRWQIEALIHRPPIVLKSGSRQSPEDICSKKPASKIKLRANTNITP